MKVINGKMKISIKRTNNAFHLIGENERGSTVSMDNLPDAGGHNKGVKPIELLPMALGGCSAFDIISILKKQKQEIEEFKITVDAGRETGKSINLFTKVHAHYFFKGNLDKEKVERAIDLSLKKYCTVAETLRRAGAMVTFSFSIEK